MKKSICLNVFAICALALPLSAASLEGAANVGGNGAVGGNKASLNGGVDTNLNANVDRAQTTPRPTSVTTPGTGNTHRPEAKLRSEYRGFEKRLKKVDARIDKAVKDGRYSAEQARKQHDDLNEIRSKFKRASDRTASKLSSEDKADLDAQVKAQEDSVAQAEQN